MSNFTTPYKLLKKTFGLLSSRVFLVWMIGGWIIYYVFSAIWMREAFGFFAAGVSGNVFVQLLFVLFLVSGYCNIIRVSREVLKKGRTRLFLRMLLPFGMMVLLTGLFLSLSTKKSVWITAGEGHSIGTPWGHESYTVTEIKSGIPESFLDTGEGGGRVFSYEPNVIVSDQMSRSFEIGSFPPARIGATYYHILNFGLAPGVRLAEQGAVKDEGYMPLRIFPPGSNDSFEIQPYPYRFLITIEPERLIQKGRKKASQYNLRNPHYRVRVLKGEKVIEDAVVTDKMRFETFTLSFFEPTFWVQIEAVKDSGVPVILAGILFICIGIPLQALSVLLREKSGPVPQASRRRE